MQRICIYKNPDGRWIYQNLTKKDSQNFGSLNSLVKNVFSHWLDFLYNRFNDNTIVSYKENQLFGYIKNIVKEFGTCFIEFPGDIKTGVIDESIKINGTSTDFIFKLK